MRWSRSIGCLVVGVLAVVIQEVKAEGVVSGNILLPEISGAAAVAGGVLIVADDPESKDQPLHMVALLQDGPSRLRSGRDVRVGPEEQLYQGMVEKLPRKKKSQKLDVKAVKDLEDVAVSPGGDIFLISSHKQVKSHQAKTKGHHLLRLRLNGADQVESLVARPGKDLLQGLPEQVVGAAGKTPGGEQVAENFDIEGLAWHPDGHLLLGLRSPLLSSHAVILRLHDVDAVFENPGEAMVVTLEAKLELEGLGVRGMCYDALSRGYWLIAGVSANPGGGESSKKRPWALWFWNGQADKERMVLLKKMPKSIGPAALALENPEAVTVLPAGKDTTPGTLLLISDNGAGQPSSFALIPFSALK